MLCCLSKGNMRLTAVTEACGNQPLLTQVPTGQASFLHQVASVMSRLLPHRPLSTVPPSQLPLYNDPLHEWKCNEPWPTPSPPKWADIQMVACRLAATLEWAADEDTVQRESDQDLSALKQLLVKLLFKLLYQHLLDANLDVQKLFR